MSNFEQTILVNDPGANYEGLLHGKETHEIISCCIEVHNHLGRGFLEAVYQEALKYEFQLRNIPYKREKLFNINYKGKILSKTYKSDFIVYDKIVLETKAQADIIQKDYRQTINYLAVTGHKIALLVNFGEDQLKFKRLIL